MLGISTSTFTLLHVLISLGGIGSGFIAVFGLLKGKLLTGWTPLFLVSTVLTSVTAFLFPVEHLLHPHKVGVISLIVLAIAIGVPHVFHLAGSWRVIYVITALMALYLNWFVGLVQAFLKIPALHALAPYQTEPAFPVAQTIVLALFIVVGVLATKRFRGAPRSWRPEGRACRRKSQAGLSVSCRNSERGRGNWSMGRGESAAVASDYAIFFLVVACRSVLAGFGCSL
jgi:hypothetical protein